jgi:cysteine desulfurase/selenocysteine lyase
MSHYDVAAVRQDFPILASTVRGRPLVYLDSAASAQRPRAVIDAVVDYETHSHSNVHRGVHYLSQRATELFESSRERVRRFLGAATVREIIFTRGTTESINLVAQAYARPRLGLGDEILITWMEHHANIVPWQIVCEQTGATLKVAPIDGNGELRLDAFERLLSERTRVVAFTAVSNALGTMLPVQGLVRSVRRLAPRAAVLIDGAQAVPHQRIDVRALDCDFFAFSGHKVYGPTGIGVLFGRESLLRSMPPWQGGGDMILNVSFAGTTYAEPPARFEAGTPNISGAIGLAAALDYLEALGIERVQAHEQRLLTRAVAALETVPGLRLIGRAAHRAGAISFVLEGIHPHDIGTIADSEGVALRTGHHCAMPVMEFFDVAATARASFGCYSDDQDIDALIAALHRAREVFG